MINFQRSVEAIQWKKAIFSITAIFTCKKVKNFFFMSHKNINSKFIEDIYTSYVYTLNYHVEYIYTHIH